MEISTRTKVITSIVVVITSFAVGRYSANTKPDVHTVIDKTQDIKQDTDKDTHKTTTITKTPDGKEVTTITEDTVIDTKKDTDTTTHVDQTVTQPKNSLINISALASLDTADGFKPVYGISANKELIGPVTIGAFGLTNGVIGLSVGVNF